jgi:hypothetical protein
MQVITEMSQVRIRRGKELKGRREVIISVWVSVQTKSVQVGAERDPPSSGSGEIYPALAGGSRLDSIA